MKIWYINLRKSLQIQISLIFSNVVLAISKAGYNLDIMRETACLYITKLWLKAMLHALVARLMPQTQWRPQCEALNNLWKIDDCHWLHPT